MALLDRRTSSTLTEGALLGSMVGVSTARAFMVMSLAWASAGSLEIPAEDLSTLVEQASLVVTCTMGGCWVIPKGRHIAGGAIRAGVMCSKTLWAGWQRLGVVKRAPPFVVPTATAPWWLFPGLWPVVYWSWASRMTCTAGWCGPWALLATHILCELPPAIHWLETVVAGLVHLDEQTKWCHCTQGKGGSSSGGGSSGEGSSSGVNRVDSSSSSSSGSSRLGTQVWLGVMMHSRKD